jgi:hypothetical protein
MTQCERCDRVVHRRQLCHHCGFYVCWECWDRREDSCACEPGHKPENCIQLNYLKKVGRARFMRTVVARLRTQAGMPLLRGMRYRP